MRKSGRHNTSKSRVSTKGSIMKRRGTKTSSNASSSTSSSRSLARNNEDDAAVASKEKLRKTVSFKPSKVPSVEEEEDEEDELAHKKKDEENPEQLGELYHTQSSPARAKSLTALQRSFDDLNKKTTTELFDQQSSPSRSSSLSSPKRIMGKISKRSKLKMFRRQQDITEGGDDDKEMIIPPHRDSSSCASGESDDGHNQSIIVSESASMTVTDTNPITAEDSFKPNSEIYASSNNCGFSRGAEPEPLRKVVDSNRSYRSKDSNMKRQVFSDSAQSSQGGRNRFSVSSSLDVPDLDNVFKERPRSCSHSPSLSRSPAVKRRNDRSIRIAGLATLGSRKFAKNLSFSRGQSITGDNDNDSGEQKQPSSIPSVNFEPEVSPNASAPKPALQPTAPPPSSKMQFEDRFEDLMVSKTSAADAARGLNRDSVVSIESSTTYSSSPMSPRRVLSPTLKPIVSYFDAPAENKPPLAVYDDGDDDDENQLRGTSVDGKFNFF